MTETVDIKTREFTESIILVAPKGTTKLSKCISTGDDHETIIFSCPLIAWKKKEELENDTNSPWELLDVGCGIDDVAIIGTREEFEQFYEDWL